MGAVLGTSEWRALECQAIKKITFPLHRKLGHLELKQYNVLWQYSRAQIGFKSYVCELHKLRLAAGLRPDPLGEL